MKETEKNEISRYLSLPYTVVIRRDEEEDYVARVDELPGCAAHGKTQPEALENLEEAKRLWISDAIEAGHAVPQPAPDEALPSGKWVQRVPRTLHRKLTILARREGVSLNQLVSTFLAEAVGWRASSQPDPDYLLNTAAHYPEVLASVEDRTGLLVWGGGHPKRLARAEAEYWDIDQPEEKSSLLLDALHSFSHGIPNLICEFKEKHDAPKTKSAAQGKR